MYKKQLRSDLERAKQLIESNGWCQGIDENESGNFCLLGAGSYHMTVEDHDASSARENRFIAALALTIFGQTDDNAIQLNDKVVKWNDAPNRTQTEVLEIIDKTLERIN